MERTFNAIIKKPTANGTVRITIPMSLVKILDLKENDELIITIKK